MYIKVELYTNTMAFIFDVIGLTVTCDENLSISPVKRVANIVQVIMN